MLLLAQIFPMEICTKKFNPHRGKHATALLAQTGWSLAGGTYGLALLVLAIISLLQSVFSLPAALQKLFLEMELIFLAGPVTCRSSHSTALQRRQHPCSPPGAAPSHEPSIFVSQGPLALVWLSVLQMLFFSTLKLCSNCLCSFQPFL